MNIVILFLFNNIQIFVQIEINTTVTLWARFHNKLCSKLFISFCNSCQHLIKVTLRCFIPYHPETIYPIHPSQPPTYSSNVLYPSLKCYSGCPVLALYLHHSLGSALTHIKRCSDPNSMQESVSCGIRCNNLDCFG